MMLLQVTILLLASTLVFANDGATLSFANNIYVSEFEILDMSNHDGTLHTGQCCNGNRGNTKSGCRSSGNSSCFPYWRICIAELSHESIPAQNRENLDSLSTTTRKPSIIHNFFSKIFGSTKTDKSRQIKEILDNMSPSKCQIGFWISDIIEPQSTFPMRLRKSLSWKLTQAFGNSTGNNNGSKFSTINRNAVSIVEIWSKNPKIEAKNRLIVRQINHYNVYIEPDSISSEWFYGGKVASKLPTGSDKRRKEIHTRTTPVNSVVSSNSRFQYKYRWHIKSIAKSRDGATAEEEINQLNIGSDGCPQGYKGSDCSSPVCLDKCHTEHGYCEKPGDCHCRFGWIGTYCNYCLTLPGCVHGYCQRPLECRCEEGWTGMFCSVPKCKEGCHSINGYCTVPGECKCKFGWQGENCTECSTLPGCQHGTCGEPLDCNCEPGWQGTFCSTPICSEGCENGWCKRPNECRCKVGFKGENCTECVPYPGCTTGKCSGNKPWTCECETGSGGITCSERLDWCEKNANPCQNGGSCASVELANGQYMCKCSLGYTGKHCERIAN